MHSLSPEEYDAVLCLVGKTPGVAYSLNNIQDPFVHCDKRSGDMLSVSTFGLEAISLKKLFLLLTQQLGMGSGGRRLFISVALMQELQKQW